jgi:hypothetical protein
MTQERRPRICYLDVVVAITDLYDEYVYEHGADHKAVFHIATRDQVAKRLGVSGAKIDSAIRGMRPYGFADYKEEVLVRHGRGSFCLDGPFRLFIPAAIEQPQEGAPNNGEMKTSHTQTLQA